MKILAIACACLVFSTAAAAADDSIVSQATLDSMGLGAMQSLSDQDGSAVRGQGTSASVWGGSIAAWGGQSSQNSYFAGSSWIGSHGSSAFGSSTSFGANFQFGQVSW